MKFNWNDYSELELKRRNTLQIYITNRCNLKCEDCFAENATRDKKDMSLSEYRKIITVLKEKGGNQINVLGGEPFLHPNLLEILEINKVNDLKTTVYTNGTLLNKYTKDDFKNVKLRVSLYKLKGELKSIYNLTETDIPFDANFMVSKSTTVDEVKECADYAEEVYNCKVFFISSLRNLNNPRQEFFDDTNNTMNVLEYKELVHNFLMLYTGDMEIHISKRGVFESTKTIPDNKCRFANCFIDGKIIQCPYDVVNLKYQEDYHFNERFCQHNNTCLMSKIKLKRNKK